MIVDTLGDRSLGRVYFKRSIEAARRLGDPIRLGWPLGWLAYTTWYVEGDWDEAIALARDLEPLRRALRGPRSSHAIGVELELKAQAGDEEALNELEREVDEALESADLHLWAWGGSHIARLDMVRGNLERAAAIARRMREHPGLEMQYRYEPDQVLAEASIEMGALDEAEAIIVPAVDLAESQGMTLVLGDWSRLLGKLRTAQERYDEARSLLDRSLEITTSLPQTFVIAHTHHDYGRLLQAMGDSTGARARYEEALTIFHRLHAVYYVARTEQALTSLGTSFISEPRLP